MGETLRRVNQVTEEKLTNEGVKLANEEMDLTNGLGNSWDNIALSNA